MKVRRACEDEVLVLRQGTAEIHFSNGCGMSSCPSSLADRWFCPTGSGAMLLREDTENGADWPIRRGDAADKAVVDRSTDKSID